jgi:hypothetical protein
VNENRFEGSIPNPAYDGVRGPDAPAALDDGGTAIVWAYAEVARESSTSGNGNLNSMVLGMQTKRRMSVWTIYTEEEREVDTKSYGEIEGR